MKIDESQEKYLIKKYFKKLEGSYCTKNMKERLIYLNTKR